MPHPLPPRWIKPLLQWLLPDYLREELEGDLQEQFLQQVEALGERKARRLYVIEVLKFFKPYFLRRRRKTFLHSQFTTTPLPLDMLTHYFTIAWRHLLRARSYSLINVTGLAIGMAAFAMIVLWLQSELTFDRSYPKTDRLFQVYNRDKFSGNLQVWETTPLPLAPALKADYPDIEQVSRYRPATFLLSAQDKNLPADGAFVDPAFLHLFDFALLTGNPQGALSQGQGIVLTQAFAQKLFGTSDVVGKTIELDHAHRFSVTGVLQDIPRHSRFQDLSYLLPWSYFESQGWGSQDWSSNNEYTFVLLKEKVKPAVINEKIKHLTAQHLKGVLADVSNRQIFLHPAAKWHLYSKPENGELVGGKIDSVRLFGLIAALILLNAAVNFINLSIARSEKRAKEVGIRKVAGAQKAGLVLQFISESVLLTLVSGMLALLLIALCLPTFNQLTGKQLTLTVGSGQFWLLSLAFVGLTGLLAGSYPAFVLASFRPLRVMKGIYQTAPTGFSPRKGLVTAQFTFAIVLMISTLAINQQIRFGQQREKGYNQQQLIFTFLSGEGPRHYPALREELLKRGVAVSVSQSLGPLTTINTRQWGLSWPGSTQADKDLEFNRFGTEAAFLQTMGSTLLAGREIDIYHYPTDSSAVMLNETALKRMRLTNPLGSRIHFDGRDWQVVGIVKDFIFASPYEPINPVIITGPASGLPLYWLSIRLNPAKDIGQNLHIAESLFKQYNPGYPFDYSFAEQSYKAKFSDQQRTSALTGFFTGLTLLISALGLFGLAAYSAEQRTKEIGIRKVLGASVASLVQLLTKDFLYLLALAFAIGAPIGWYAVETWLEHFPYRITLGAGAFIFPLVTAIGIVLLTVGLQAIQAALKNPVKTLRTE